MGWFEDEIDEWLEGRRRGALEKTIEKPVAANLSNESPADPAEVLNSGSTPPSRPQPDYEGAGTAGQGTE